MKINLFDNDKHLEFAPLTLLKPVAKLLFGGYTFEDRWKHFFPSAKFGYVTEPYLSKKFTVIEEVDFHVAANIVATQTLANFLVNMPQGNLYYQGSVIAVKGVSDNRVEFPDSLVVIEKRWDLYLKNTEVLRTDFALLTNGQVGQKLSDTNTLIGDITQLFIAKGATVEASILNLTEGPIFIAKGAEIMEGSMVRGPLYLGEKAALKMGTKIYGATTIGNHTKIGGEVTNAVFQNYSNKGHDGFVGNALIGEWCNIGADTNSSNLKNNYGAIRTYNYARQGEEQTNEQFMGLTMGDHSKCGINTMFNTATVIGISANVYGGDFPDKFIPSFAWGGSTWEKFKLDKAIEAANNMMIRRGEKLMQVDIEILEYLYGID